MNLGGAPAAAWLLSIIVATNVSLRSVTCVWKGERTRFLITFAHVTHICLPMLFSCSHIHGSMSKTPSTLGVDSRSLRFTFVAISNIRATGFPISRGTLAQLYAPIGRPLHEHVTRTPQGEICITRAPRVTITAPPSGNTCTVAPSACSMVGCSRALGTGIEVIGGSGCPLLGKEGVAKTFCESESGLGVVRGVCWRWYVEAAAEAFSGELVLMRCCILDAG